MKNIQFSNGITYGQMLVSEEWYNAHSDINDSYKLYEEAEKDIENSKMVLLYILDVGKPTVDCIVLNR